MQFKHLTLTAAMLISMASASAQSLEGDFAEWELLKAYLTQVEKNSELEIQTAHADYKLRRLIFKESNRRWWEAYKEDQREKKINEYWSKFHAGQNYARSIVSKSVGDYCKLLDKIDLSSIKSPVEDEVINTAFERGFKGAYPECSIANLDQFLKETDKKITAIETKLKTIKADLLFSKLSEKDIEVVYGELKKKYVEGVKNHILVSKDKLEKSFVLPEADVKRLKESVDTLAQAIECSTFKSHYGSKFKCTFQVLESPVKLATASTYRVFTGQQETGVFQPRINLGQLFEATAIYLKEGNNKQIVRYLLNDVNVNLARLQSESDRKIAGARTLIAEDFFNQMRTLKFDTIDLNRGSFSREVATGIIKDLIAIKSAVESYVRMDISTQYEEGILKKVLTHYRTTLGFAASLSAEIKLPARDIIVTLEDEESADVITLDPMKTPPKAYLLGVNPDEVRDWMEFLKL